MFWYALGAVQIFQILENKKYIMKFTYLLVNFFTVIIPLLYSFHPKLNFHTTWRSFLPALFITAIYFIIWDAYFTSIGVWGFNPQYLTGINIGNLPVEEILFFFCIPYACVFTFHCLDILLKIRINLKTVNIITLVITAALLCIAVLYHQQVYTVSTFVSLAIFLLLARFVLRVDWLGKFYIVYGLLLLPFLVVNGILTGTGLENPVVWYNESEIIGMRILTIPVEDIFYGMKLILLNLILYKYSASESRLRNKSYSTVHNLDK